MLKLVSFLAASVLAASLMLTAVAQQPPPRSDDKSKADQKQKESPIVTKLMGYSKKEPGKLSRDEVTDERLLRLFDMADTKKEGVVTKEQLIVAAAKLEAEMPAGGGRGGPGGGGPGGPGGGRGGPGGPGGGPGGFGGGPGGPGGFGGGPGGRGGPQMGVLMPDFIQEDLNLTASQKKQVADLQKEVDAKLEKLLTADQRKMLKEMKDNQGRGGPGGPGGRGGPGGGGLGGPGGRGGPGGPPPDGPPPEGESQE